MKMKGFLTLTVLLYTVSSMTMFNQVELTKKNGAMCMDGSAYSVYVYEPDPTDFKVIANKVLVYFEDVPFGWCFQNSTSASLEECHKFITEDNLKDYGSSDDWESNFFFLSGILSAQGESYFVNWPKVFLKNCDGGSFMGDSDPVLFKRNKIYFRGTQNIKEAVAYLNKKNYLRNREQIVLAGSFNGGVAAQLWSSYFKNQTDGSVKVIADASIFINTLNVKHNNTQIQDRMKEVAKFTLENTSLPNAACAEANKDEIWRCLFSGELVKYIDEPVYYLQSFYDGFGIEEVLGYKCTYQFGSLSECTQEERQVINLYHANISKVLSQAVEKEVNSAFGIACVGHSFLSGRWNNQEFQVPALSGHRPESLTSAWAQGKGRQMYIDDVKWPDNKPCAGKLKISNSLSRQKIIPMMN